jgi:hypothetical protein
MRLSRTTNPVASDTSRNLNDAPQEEVEPDASSDLVLPFARSIRR